MKKKTLLGKYLTLPYLYGHRDRKATRPGDPVLTELMIVDIQDSYGFGVSNIMFVQCLSSRFLKLLSVSADTTDEGSEFQSLTILVLNTFLRVSVLARGLYSFHPWPRVNSDSFLLKKSSGDTSIPPWNSLYTVTISPRRRR